MPTTDAGGEAAGQWEDWGEGDDDVEMQATSGAIMSSSQEAADPGAAAAAPATPEPRKPKEPSFAKKDPVFKKKEPSFGKKEDAREAAGDDGVPPSGPSARPPVARKDPEKKPDFIPPKKEQSFGKKVPLVSTPEPMLSPEPAEQPRAAPAVKAASPGIPGMSLSMAKKPDRKRDR